MNKRFTPNQVALIVILVGFIAIVGVGEYLFVQSLMAENHMPAAEDFESAYLQIDYFPRYPTYYDINGSANLKQAVKDLPTHYYVYRFEKYADDFIPYFSGKLERTSMSKVGDVDVPFRLTANTDWVEVNDTIKITLATPSKWRWPDPYVFQNQDASNNGSLTKIFTVSHKDIALKFSVVGTEKTQVCVSGNFFRCDKYKEETGYPTLTPMIFVEFKG